MATNEATVNGAARRISWLRVAVMTLAAVAVMAILLFEFESFSASTYACDIDFGMRYNEAQAVRSGRDPLLIWNGTLPRGEFTPWTFRNYRYYMNYRSVHAYTPWTYTLMLPLAALDWCTAREVYFWLQGLALLGIVGLAALVLFRSTGSLALVALGVVTMGAAAEGIVRCVIVGNFGLLVTAAAMLALWCHSRGREALAGVFWALTLVKPQLGALFFLWVLVEGKWRTALVTLGVLALLTLPPAWLCHRSPIDLVLAFTEYSKDGFANTGLFTPAAFAALKAEWGEPALRLVSAVAGGGIPLAAMVLVRGRGSVWVRAFFPAVGALIWSVSRLHDYSLQLLILFSGLMLLISLERRYRPWAAAVLVLLSLRAPLWILQDVLVALNLCVLAATVPLALALRRSGERQANMI